MFLLKWFKNLFKIYFVNILPFIVVFSASLYVPSDSDLGWHLKYGEYFFKTGHILRDNIFATMMPNFHWVNSSWATDVLSYLTFNFLGFYGLSLLGALVITLIFYFFAKGTKLNFWEKVILFPIIIFMEKPLFDVSFRGQLLSLMSIGILYLLLSEFENGKRKSLIWILPLFTIWSNFHGQFILGLGIFFFWIVFYLIKQIIITKEKNIKVNLSSDVKYLSLILFLAVIASLINPFGWRIMDESIRHFGNPLQKFIIEWLPFERFSFLWWKLIFYEVFVLLSLWIILQQKKFSQNLPWIGLTIILLILSFFVRRYMWVMLLVSMPIVRYTAISIKPKNQEISNTIAVFVLAILYGYYIFVSIPKQNILTMDWQRYCRQYVGCSIPSAEFLVINKPAGKMLTFYNWGGWLIWNYPQIKPSIDGRMHLWRDERGYSAFEEYYPIEQNFKDIDQSDYDVVYMTTAKVLHTRMLELVKEKKWEMIYHDEKASVFVRNKDPKS